MSGSGVDQPAAGQALAGTAPSCGQLLRRYRSQAGLTQEELGDRSAYSANYIGKLERDQRELPVAALDRFATILGLRDEERAALQAARDARRGGGLRARPLAGREREMGELRRHLAGLGAPVLLFAGEPGIGKTRLLQEAVWRAARSGRRVLQGGCQRRAQDPYAPVTDALLDALEHLPEAERAEALRRAGGLELLLPELTAAAATATFDERGDLWSHRELEPEQRRRLLFSAVARFLRAVAGEAEGVLLVLDDLQWAGPDALDLLTTLLAAAQSPAIGLIGAYRDSDVAAGSRLGEFVADLARAARVQVLGLEPLSDTESEQLIIQSAADAEEVRALVPAIVRRAGGVPFFMVSFVEDLPAAERGSPHFTLPWTVRQVIGQRVLALPESARELLAVAAVVGRVVSHSLLVAVSGRSEDDVLAALEAATAARLMAEDEEAGYRFTHDLIRETIEDGLSAGRRRLLHRRIAQTLERERASAETLAFHFALGDDQEKAIAYLELAGEEAQQRVAYSTAAEFFQQAIDRLQSARRPQDAARLRERLGVALYRIGRYDEAITALEAALETYRATAEEDAVDRLTGRLADAHFRAGTSDDDLEQIVSRMQGGELVPGNAVSENALTRWQALVRLLFARGSHKQLVRMGRSLARVGRASGNPKLQRLGNRVQGGALIFLGRVREGTTLLATTMPSDPVSEQDDRAPEVAALLSAAQLSMGHLQSSLALSARMLRAAESTGDAVVAAMHTVLLAAILYVQGDWQHGRQLLRRAQERLNAVGPSPLSLGMVPVLGQTLIWAGDSQQARSYLETSVHTARAMRLAEIERAAIVHLAQLDLLEGDPEAALTRLHPLQRKDLDWSYAVSLLATIAAAQLERGDPAHAQAHAERAVAEARRIGGWISGIRALEIWGTIEARRGNHDLANTAYREGLERARAIPFPYGEAQILHASGLLDRDRGNETSAHAQLTEALALFKRLGAQRETATLRHTITPTLQD